MTIIRIGKAISVFGIVILSTILVSGCLGGGGGGTWIPRVGDFLEYSFPMSEVNTTTRIQIVSVNNATLTLNITLMVSGYPPQSGEETIHKSDVFGFFYNVNNPPNGTTVTKVGTEEISTKWGLRSADHYNMTREGDPITTEIWMRSGIVLKVNRSLGGQTITDLLLIDTNIPQITNA